MRFTKENLLDDGMYITYSPTECRWDVKNKFVARFKGPSRGSRGPFMTFLCKNFTVEEYFARLDAGETPLAIVGSKGFVLSHIKSWLKRDGYPPTKAGYDAWFAVHMNKIKEVV